jgi:outer membrane protein OmpA-like peptidoglycan-associated protein
MRRTRILWAASGLLVLAPIVMAQAPADETVSPADVRTWTLTVDGQEYEAHPATPTYGGDTGLFHLSSAYTLPRGKASISLFRNNLDRDPKDEDISIHGFTLAYGATERLELFGSIGLQNRIDADALFQPGFVNDFPFVTTAWQTGFGDVWLGAKLNLLSDLRGESVGFAVKGFVKVPTADEEKGLGTGKLSGGADLVVTKSVAGVIDLHGSLGYQLNADPDDVDLGNAFRWGLGLNIPAREWLQVQAELTGATYSGGDFEQTRPVDFVVGPVLYIRPGFFIRPAISWNLNFDDRGLDSGVRSYTGRQISIGYHPGARGPALYAPPPPAAPPGAGANRPPTVTCSWERTTIRPGESVRIRASASDPDGDPITYQWSATVGQITGEGAEVTLDTAGAGGTAPLSVTVRVSDRRGGVGQATCAGRFDTQARVEAVTCTSGGFPRNSDRLNNVDKACLDDVAARLRQDPRSRVVVVGHADAAERYVEVTARKRAEAAKRYLVQDRGIEESRITVRGAGAARAAGPGSNRRVEITFVPAGAAAPPER